MLVQSPGKSGRVNAAESEITLYSKDNKVPVYQAGKKKRGSWKSRIIQSRIFWGHGFFPEMGNSSEEWPFVTDYQDYGQTIDLPAGADGRDCIFLLHRGRMLRRAGIRLHFLSMQKARRWLIRNFMSTRLQRKNPGQQMCQQNREPPLHTRTQEDSAMGMPYTVAGLVQGEPEQRAAVQSRGLS